MDPVQKAVFNHTFGVPPSLKRKQVISCNICHLRFNSTNQAEAHYKGHRHARKLKALQAQRGRQRHPGETGGACREKEREAEKERTSTLEVPPALMDVNVMDGMSLLAEASALKLDKSPGRSVMLTSISEISSLDLDTLSSPQPSSCSGVSETVSERCTPETPPCQESPQVHGPELQTEGHGDLRKNKQHLTCPVCKVTVNSMSQLEAHNRGTRHKLMLGGQSALPRRRGKAGSSRSTSRTKRLGPKGGVAAASKAFHCPICEIHVNSETQLKQHTNSRRHKDRLAGKPPKPRFSPHSKSQQSTVLPSVRWSGHTGGAVSTIKKVFSNRSLTSLSPQTKVALLKQLTKSVSSGFLSDPMSTATLCTLATSPFTVRHPVCATTFIQAPILSPALFRPASGPLRATHTPVIFSPY
ncbi:hypothetical protein GJAV_G00219040 [Gymnothorax javanicus]|nr:hypothetical protein GJAV_G00219040 [Gymnothorax javanicus]